MTRLKEALLVVGLLALLALAVVFGAKEWARRLAAELERKRTLEDARKAEAETVKAAREKHDAGVAAVEARLDEQLGRDTIDVGHELAVEQWRRENPTGGKP